MKGQPAYSGISLFKVMFLGHWYDISDVGTEELVKEFLICMRFCGFNWKIRCHIIRLYAEFAIK
ncbi:MAG: transposase [Flavobacteriales bacterium Tduv]